MAERRMLSLKIVDTDRFLAMEQGARLLYYDLCIRADDDGFVGSPQRISNATGACKEDMNVLLLKQYIFLFESGVCVVKDWRVHNYIPSDRYRSTIYKDEKSQLRYDENKAYTKCIQDVDKLDTQDRLGKDSVNQTPLVESADLSFLIADCFDKFMSTYPRKQNRKEAEAVYIKLFDGMDESAITDLAQKILGGLRLAYREWEIQNIEQRYIPLPAKWLTNERWNDEHTAAAAHKSKDEKLGFATDGGGV